MYRAIFILFLISGCHNNSVDEKKKNIVAKRLQTLKEKDPFILNSYCNERFSYCINYPVFFMFPDPETLNADGRIFRNKDGEEVLRVYGRLRPYTDRNAGFALEQYKKDLAEIENESLTGEITIKEKRAANNGYLISGETRNKIFYQKMIIKDFTLAYAILHYNKSEIQTFDKVAGKILTSFN